MLRRFISFFLLISIFLTAQRSFCQKVDSTSIGINSRLSFYSFEKSGEFLIHMPTILSGRLLNISLKAGDSELGSWKGIPGKKILRLPFIIGMPEGEYQVRAEIFSGSSIKYSAKTTLTILRPKVNEVKIDRYTGGLIVNRRIFFPFGFYCYSPVYQTLPEEEIVRGFNMISPYQKILPRTLNERKAYMDRCAQLGMKVHYNLLSVSGGGGVSTRIEGITDEQKRELLLSEIKAFMDHPALLAWYISDEPTGNKISPAQLAEIYRLLKKTDPWHPVSIVFMAPFLSSKRYSNAMDIVMADPYPVPNAPVAEVGNVARQLRAEFYGKNPVWIVPQAFGGGEWWGREPSIQELRSMTYNSIINGARGIQYFIRHGPNSFPKSTAAWNECGRMALEIAEITPWLLSEEEPMPVKALSDIAVTSALHDGWLLIMAVNKINIPQRADIRIIGLTGGQADVLFENRRINVPSGLLSDYLPAFGSQVYLIKIKPGKEKVTPYAGNLTRDPGFEDTSSPGVPASCYAWNEGDKGATYFLDSREHFEGNHSLRLVTPEQNKGCRLRFYPVQVSNGRTYTISIQAKTDPRFITSVKDLSSTLSRLNYEKDSLYFEIGLGDFGKTRFYPGPEWQEFVTSVTIPEDNKLPARTNVILRMPGEGAAWFDMIQLFQSVDIYRSINPELRGEWNDN